MDFYFDDLPSTSQSTPKSGQEDSQMTEDTDNESPRGKSSSLSMTDIQEQNTSSKDKLVAKVTEMCQQMKEHLFTVYEENSNEMQLKLLELSEVLESCTKLNSELLEASHALAGLRGALAISKTSETQKLSDVRIIC
ncbi:hypothetical protein KUCAC02_016050 [Chaenocephalus aceratus]|uniref:Uncharacterized protein n=1 Tax=Chaenocephalus aceratus TaxID=36190 RepID=A0ACB9XZX7_CHAAC|nr:hypothetical protein KUCAC02_016050 [Chaenocephalus aceratus]